MSSIKDKRDACKKINQVYDPKLKKCRQRKRRSSKVTKSAKPLKSVKDSVSIKCPNNKILNPKTKRCVLKTGKLGKKLMEKNPKQGSGGVKPQSKSKDTFTGSQLYNAAERMCKDKLAELKAALQKQSKRKSPQMLPKYKKIILGRFMVKFTKELKDIHQYAFQIRKNPSMPIKDAKKRLDILSKKMTEMVVTVNKVRWPTYLDETNDDYYIGQFHNLKNRFKN